MEWRGVLVVGERWERRERAQDMAVSGFSRVRRRERREGLCERLKL